MTKILFVCLGNICRSPMAEGIFKKTLQEHGVENLYVIESRATSTWEIGNPPHTGTRKILDRIGFDWTGMKSKQIAQDDFEKFDYIIGMDYKNVDYLWKHAGIYKEKVYLLRDIDPNTKNQDIPDPYFNNTHETTYALLKESLEQWFNKFTDQNRK